VGFMREIWVRPTVWRVWVCQFTCKGGGGWGGGRTLTLLRGSVAVRSTWARDCLGVFVAIVNLWERDLMEGQWEDMRRWRMGESMGGD